MKFFTNNYKNQEPNCLCYHNLFIIPTRIVPLYL